MERRLDLPRIPHPSARREAMRRATDMQRTERLIRLPRRKLKPKLSKMTTATSMRQFKDTVFSVSAIDVSGYEWFRAAQFGLISRYVLSGTQIVRCIPWDIIRGPGDKASVLSLRCWVATGDESCIGGPISVFIHADIFT